jgi:hypothetical protein
MRKAAQIAGWALVIVVIALSLVPPSLRPHTGVPHHLEHLAIFALTGLAFGLAYDRKLVATLIGLVLFAGAIELAQLFVPGRHSRLSDFIVDALAGCAGAVLASITARTLGQES